MTTSGSTTISGISITNCTLSEGAFGLRFYHNTADNGNVTDITVSNNTIHDIALVGMYFQSAGASGTNFNYGSVTISGNTIYNIIGSQAASGAGYGWAIYFRSASTSIGPSTISGNLIHDCGASCNTALGGGGLGIGVQGCVGTVIEGNVVYNVVAPGANNDSSAYDVDGENSNVLVQYNVAYNINGAGLATFSDSGYTGNVFRFNLCANVAETKFGAVRLDSDTGSNGAGGYDFYNNTFTSLSGQPCVWFDSVGSLATYKNKRFFNNIFYISSDVATMNVPTLDSSFVLNGNAYDSGGSFSASINGTNYSSLSAWKTATSMESGGTAFTNVPFLAPSPIPAITPTDLDLAWAFGLKAGSVLLTSGVNLTSLYSINPGTQDLLGNTISPSSLAQGAINVVLSYTLIGPTTGVKGVPSTNFTLTPSTSVSDTITLSDGGSGGLFTPSSITFNSSATPATFTYVPAAPGAYALSLTSALGAAVSGSPATYASSPAYIWRYVQSNSYLSGSGSTAQVAFGSPVTAGNLVVVAVTVWHSNDVTSVSDNKGNTYHKAVEANNSGSGYTHIWYAVATTGGPLTITATIAASDGATVAVGEYSYPPGAVISVDATEQGHAGSAGTVVSLGSIPVTKPDLLVMVANLGGSTGTSTAGSGWSMRQNTPGGGGMAYQDQLNPSSSPVTSTLSLANGAYWTAVSGAFLASVPTYELIGPSSVAIGTTAAFNLIPTGTVLSDTIALSDGGFGGTFSQTSLSFSSTPFADSFTYTPTNTGRAVLTATSAEGYSIGASPWQLGSYVNYTLSGPSTGLVSVPSTFSLTPASATTDTISFSDNGAGGLFIPSSLAFTNSNAPQEFTYTPAASGTATLTLASANGGSIAGSPFAITSVAVVLSAYAVKSGTLFMFVAAQSYGAANGTYPVVTITAVNANPTINVNGQAVAIGPATWTETDKSASIVAFRANCGSVRSITVSSGGSGYVAPSASASGGGGAGLVLGTPVLASGVTSYTVTAPGSGMTNGTYWWQVPSSGQTVGWQTNAQGYVTVAGGAVTSVVPLMGSVQGYGNGYDVTSFTASFNGAGGTAATITCHVSNYVQSVPVVSGGSGYTSAPTITITDSSGSGCVPAVIMSGPAPTDTITYSAPAGWLTTSLGSTSAAVAAPVTNSVGQNEGPSGNIAGFTQKQTMLAGAEVTGQLTFSQDATGSTMKNKLKCADTWSKGTGTSSLIQDVNYYPVSWTPGGTIYTQFYANSAGSPAIYTGNFTLVYDDAYYATPSGAPAPTAVTITPNSGFSCDLVSSAVSGTTVTIIYNVQINNGYRAQWIGLTLNVVAPPDGLWHISDPWVFAPNNTIDRSNPFAVDDNVVNILTGPSGTVPACFRFMDALGGPGGQQNYVDGEDIFSPNLLSWNVPYCGKNPGTPIGDPYPSGLCAFQYARYLNTTTSSQTYTWSSTKLYSSQAWAVSGSDSFGNYLSLTNGPFGVNDNGMIVSNGLYNQSNSQFGVVEFRTTQSGGHGFKTGQIVGLYGTFSLPWTHFGSVAWNGGDYAVFVTSAVHDCGALRL